MDIEELYQRQGFYEHRGSSMNPTLMPGDRMRVVPYGRGKIRVGDVVLFPCSDGAKNVVHRVISVDPRGIRTRGDNNHLVDSSVLQPSDIIGKVVSVFRKHRTLRIHNGWSGHLIGAIFRTRRVIVLRLFHFLHPLYFWLARTKIFQLPSQWLKLQVISFQRTQGIELQLRVWRRWTIGSYRPGQRTWRLRRPFKLFIDEAALPTPKDHNGLKQDSV